MATKEEITKIIECFHMNMPKHFANKMDRTNAGMGQVMFYLENANRPVSAGEISAFMHVSTARVAVLLRCIGEKGWIERANDPADARKTMITISEEGRAHIARHHREFGDTVSAIIDRVGADRMLAFFETAREINEIVAERIKTTCVTDPRDEE